MVESQIIDRLIYQLLRGFREAFEVGKIIQEGVSYKRIPKSFWEDEEKCGYGILGIERKLSKAELRKIRQKIIDRIILEIQNPSEEKMYCDNYSRLFHALAIFRVPKDITTVPAIGRDFMYNIAYDLWALDDGSDETYKYIASVAWYASEATKAECEYTKEHLMTGRRHTIT